jgi:hypothetical protein
MRMELRLIAKRKLCHLEAQEEEGQFIKVTDMHILKFNCS